MPLEVFIPLLNGESKNSKDIILSILFREFPLSAKKIFNKMKQDYTYSGTYQSVFKSLKELELHNILQRRDYDYMIHEEWINKIKAFSDGLHNNYSDKDKKVIFGYPNPIFDKGIQKIDFNNIRDLYLFIRKIEDNYLAKEKQNKKILWVTPHYWPPLLFGWKEFNRVKTLKENDAKFFLVHDSNGSLGKLTLDFMNQHKLCIMKRKNILKHSETGIYGDLILEIFYPKSFNIVRKQFERNDAFLGSDLYKLVSLRDEEHKITVVINRDKDIAERIWNSMITEGEKINKN